MSAASASSSAPRGPLGAEAVLEPRLGAVREVRARIPLEGNALDAQTFGLSPPQVYALLGTPSNVNTSSDRVRWYYHDTGTPGGLYVVFVDGYVAYLVNEGGG